MAYQPPYDNIDELNVRNTLERDIAYNKDNIAEVDERIAGMELRRQQALRDGNTFRANNLQNNIDSQTAFKGRLQEQIDGSTADLAVVTQRQSPQQTDTAQNQIENNPPSDNNPDVETLPLAEEAQLEEVDLTPSDTDDVGETLPEINPTEVTSVDDLPPLEESQTSATNEELVTTNDIGQIPTVDVSAERLPQEQYIEYPNILHDYPSYTYGLSLHLLTGDDWNDLSSTGEYRPKNVLIASAGKFDQTIGPNKLLRNKYFNEDFYFDNLDITTIIGPTDTNPGSNAINLNFTIVEPYGVTLLNRIIAATIELSSSEKTTNYLENPYMMQIDFYGQSADGSVSGPITGITKYVPIKIVNFDFDVSTNGSRYNIQAVPFNHGAFDTYTQKTPVTMEITAGTVADFFSGGNTASDGQLLKSAEKLEETQRAEYQANLLDGIDSRNVNPALMQGLKVARSQLFKVSGYASAWNAYYQSLVKNGNQRYNDTIQFNFDEKIGQAKLTEQGKISTGDTAQSTARDRQDDQVSKTQPANKKTAVSYMDTTLKRHAINYGTSIESVIEDIITNSTYVTDQLTDPTDFGGDYDKYVKARLAKKDKPFSWFKIIPEVKLEKFDSTTMLWTRKIIYNVVTYDVRNSKLSTMPGAKARIPLKKYKYLYTGENTDILNLDIKFNATYFTAVTSHTAKLTKDKNLIQANDEEDQVVKDIERSKQNTIQPKHIRAQISDSKKTATGGGVTTKQMTALDATKSILTEATGDMINVNLEIIGDPLFIKQDDIFYQQSVKKTKFKSGRVTPNGSFITDTGEVYVKLEINSATDLDQSTGNYDINDSLFNGMYKVIQVESKFADGKFTQVLNLVRLFDQDIDEESTDDSAEERAESTVGGYDPEQQNMGVNATDDNNNVVALDTVNNEVAADSLPEQLDSTQVVQLDEAGNDIASRQEFQDLERQFENANNPFDGIPADGSVLDQQAGINNLFGR